MLSWKRCNIICETPQPSMRRHLLVLLCSKSCVDRIEAIRVFGTSAGVVWRRLQSYCGTYEWSVRARSGRSPSVPFFPGQTTKDKGHAGITPYGPCETVLLGPPEIPSRGAYCTG